MEKLTNTTEHKFAILRILPYARILKIPLNAINLYVPVYRAVNPAGLLFVPTFITSSLRLQTSKKISLILPGPYFSLPLPVYAILGYIFQASAFIKAPGKTHILILIYLHFSFL